MIKPLDPLRMPEDIEMDIVRGEAMPIIIAGDVAFGIMRGSLVGKPQNANFPPAAGRGRQGALLASRAVL